MDLIGAGASVPHIQQRQRAGVTLTTADQNQNIALGGSVADSATQLGLSAAELATVTGTGGSR
ncbi:MAG: hypothetical protein KF778_14160 [Rhodocyclaceae bacterium]|nr:hypothetical protein [Rhodocyclaceae bacterium]